MFLQLDGTFWFQALNFAIFFAILNVVFLRPVGAAIRKRRAYIDGVQHDYERYRTEAQKLRREAETKRAAARREADESIAAARAAAELEAGKLVLERTSAAHAIADEARRNVERELQAAKANEQRLSAELAELLLQRAVGVSP